MTKKLLTFFGHDAIKVAKGTNRLPEILQDDGGRWQEMHLWKCQSTADRFPHKVRVRGYASSLLKNANDEARAIIESAQ